jgi:hypothetical protein
MSFFDELDKNDKIRLEKQGLITSEIELAKPKKSKGT